MNILITGGAGFIGSNAVQYFAKEGHNVVVVDRLTYASDARRINNLENVRLIIGDISQTYWKYTFNREKPDVVINYAAESHVDNSIKAENGRNFINSNVAGVFELVSGIVTCDHKPKLFVHISTDEVLGDFPLDSQTSGWDFTAPLDPHNLYSATKASAELVIRAMHRTYKGTPQAFQYLILRATNNYGPGQHFEKFLPTIITSILSNKKIPVYGQGLNVREWLWVFDFVRGTKMAIEQALEGGAVNETFHFGSNVRKKNIDVVKEVLKAMDAPESLIQFVPDRLGHDQMYALDYTDTKKAIGWEPEQQFEYGIKSVIEDVRTRSNHGKKN